MSTLQDLKDALAAKKGIAYFDAFQALMQGLIDGQEDIAATLAELLTATSTTSATIGVGFHTINIGPGYKYATGNQIVVAHDASHLMFATVSSYTDDMTGALVFEVAAGDNEIIGTGTFTSWTISLAGPAGPAGSNGLQGDPGADGSNSPFSALGAFYQLGTWGT